MALDAVVASPTFNAYCDVAFADSYHGGRLHNEAYRCATTADKEAGLIWATRQLDTLYWKGLRTVATQPQAWPRQGVVYDNRYGFGDSMPYGFSSVYSSVFLDQYTIPVYIKNATAELAFWLMSNDATAPAGTEGFSRIKIDTIELVMNSSDRQRWMNAAVYDMLYRFLLDNSGGVSVHKVVT